jgi:hypothetical protein
MVISTPVLRKLQNFRKLRGCHASFNFDAKTGDLSIRKASSAADALVCAGVHVIATGVAQALEPDRLITVGPLMLRLDFTDILDEKEYLQCRDKYMAKYLRLTEPVSDLIPTPIRPSSRTCQQWRFRKDLGKGKFGKVWCATNPRNEVVAIKVVERNEKTAQIVADQIETLERLKALTIAENDQGRLVRLREVIYEKGKAKFAPTVFEEVCIVLEPMVEGTFASLMWTPGNAQ